MTERRPDSIRVMTWNIHGGIGPDGRFDLDRIAKLILRHDPDIVALQEIETRGRGPDSLQPLRMLFEARGHWHEARTISAPDGDYYGHALLSRWPMQHGRLHDLSFSDREPRFAIEAKIDSPHGPLHMVSAHLGLALSERRMQAGKLAKLAHPGGGEPGIVVGDFNDWFAFGAVRRALRAVLPQRTMLKTFPARAPIFRLDRIYVKGPARLTAAWSDREARTCSDHLPVIADIAPRASD